MEIAFTFDRSHFSNNVFLFLGNSGDRQRRYRKEYLGYIMSQHSQLYCAYNDLPGLEEEQAIDE